MYNSINPSIDFTEIKDHCESYFKEHMADDTLVAWVAETEQGEVAACIAASLYELPPKPENPDGRYIYIFNMFTAHLHRRKGGWKQASYSSVGLRKKDRDRKRQTTRV